MAVVFDDQDTDTTAPAPAGSGKVVFDDENEPQWSDLPGNIIPDAKAVGESSLDQTGRIAKGYLDLPSDALETAKGEFEGDNPFNPETSPLAADAKTIGSGIVNTVEGLPKQLGNLFSKENLIEHPVQNALTAGSLAGMLKGLLPEGSAPVAPEMPVEESGLAEKALQAVPVSSPDKDLSLEPMGTKGPTPEPASRIAPPTPTPAEPTETMYHGTTSNAADSINKNGFGTPDALNKDMVFITKDKNAAMDYAKYAAEHYEKGGKPALVEMQVPRSKLAVSHDLEMGKPFTTEQANMITGHPERTLDDYLNPTGSNKGYFLLDNKTANEALRNASPQLEPMGAKGPIPEPASRLPPDPNAPKPVTPPPPAPSKLSGISDEIKNYVNQKYQAAQAKPGLVPKIGKYLTEESNKLGSKDIGLQSGLIKTMGTGFNGIEKANQLVDYARDKGYLRAGLSDADRRGLIKTNLDNSGSIIGKMRDVADSRGAPDVDAIKSAVKTALDQKYGSGTEKAPTEIANVMEDIDKAPKTFKGMTELATKLNKSATPIGKLGQHPGPTTDAADIVAKMANDGARRTFSPEENNLYTKNLRDFGANKKLEQTTANSARRELGARSNQRGIIGRAFQEALDRGGYRLGGNVAHGIGKAIGEGKIKTLPEFFEELGHKSNEEIDNTINNMAHGGIVPDDVRQFVESRK